MSCIPTLSFIPLTKPALYCKTAWRTTDSGGEIYFIQVLAVGLRILNQDQAVQKKIGLVPNTLSLLSAPKGIFADHDWGQIHHKKVPAAFERLLERGVQWKSQQEHSTRSFLRRTQSVKARKNCNSKQDCCHGIVPWWWDSASDTNLPFTPVRLKQALASKWFVWAPDTWQGATSTVWWLCKREQVCIYMRLDFVLSVLLLTPKHSLSCRLRFWASQHLVNHQIAHNCILHLFLFKTLWADWDCHSACVYPCKSQLVCLLRFYGK